MAYDNLIKFPQGNTALLAAAEVTFEQPRTVRHHGHLLRAKANKVSDGSALTDIADIIDTLEYQLNGRTFIAPLTVAQHRYRQNTYDNENYAGNQPGSLLINFREWQNELGGDQDVHSIAMGGVVSFTTIIKFKAGIKDIVMDESRIICDDGVTVDAAGKAVVIPLIITRTIEKFSVQNSMAGEFLLPQFSLRTGAIKRVTFEDAGKIDRVEFLHNDRVTLYVTRDTMKAWMLDVLGLTDAVADTANRFTIPFDFLNRGLSGMGMRNADGTPARIEFRVKTNASGGFPGIIERAENPLTTAA